MEEGSVAHNRGPSPAAPETVSDAVAQEQLALLINRVAATTVSHCWKLLGEDPNSLCRLLDMPWSDLQSILRKCDMLCGLNDSFRTKKFEDLMNQIGCHWVMCRPKKKTEHCLTLGGQEDNAHGDGVLVPKEMCSAGGALHKFPIAGVHMPRVRTKGTRNMASSLLRMATAAAELPSPSDHNVPANDADEESNKASMTTYVDDLLGVVEKETMTAAKVGDSYAFTQRNKRMIRKAVVQAIKGSTKTFVEAWVDRIGDDNKIAAENCTSTPLPQCTRPSRGVMAAGLNAGTSSVHQEQAHATPPLDLTNGNEEDERDIDIFLSKLKEETTLQNLLHKRLLRRDRVLMLEHKNGRKFRVILPPDASTSKSFLEEAKRTQWVKQMLHSDPHLEGVLLCLAQTQPAKHVSVAEKKKIRITSQALDTSQTLALGRLTGVNDTQMYKLRSFLRHVGNAELKLSSAEVARIDRDVGLDFMPEANFNTHAIEWATAGVNGADKNSKQPEASLFLLE